MITKTMKQNYLAAEERFWGHYAVKPREQYLTLGSTNTSVRVLEVGEGPPVLFIHGGPNAGSTWAPVAQALQDFRCIILDRPGCGLSEAVDYDAIDIKTFAIDVLCDLLDALGIGKTAIVASSFGSAWALWFAETHPERVDRIVHEGCPPFLEGGKVPMFMRMMMIRPIGRMIAKQTATEASTHMTFRQLGHGALIESGRFLPVFMDWGLSMMNDTDTMKNEVSVIQHGSRGFRFRPELTHAPAVLQRMPHPTLFLWGEADPFGDVEVGLQACRHLPHAVLRSFPNSGHLPWMDDPAGHVAIIREFLNSETNGRAVTPGRADG